MNAMDLESRSSSRQVKDRRRVVLGGSKDHSATRHARLSRFVIAQLVEQLHIKESAVDSISTND